MNTKNRLRQLSKKLEDIERQENERKRLRRQLEDVREEQAQVRSARLRHRRLLQEAEQDVEDLKGMSLTSFFHSIFGDKIRTLDREKKEVAKAKAAYEESKDAAEDLKDEVEQYKRQLEELDHLQERREELLEEKEELIKQSDHPEAERLRTLSKQIGAARSRIEKIEDAIHAGSQLLTHVSRVRGMIRSARNMRRNRGFGSGFHSEMTRRGKLRRARTLNRNTQFYKRRYQREIEELKTTDFELPGRISVSDDGGALNLMSDGFSGLFGPSGIDKSIEQTKAYKGQIQRQISSLKTRKDQLIESLRKKQQEREDIIQNG